MAYAPKQPQAPSIWATRDPATLGEHERVGEIFGVGVLRNSLPRKIGCMPGFGWVFRFVSYITRTPNLVYTISTLSSVIVLEVRFEMRQKNRRTSSWLRYCALLVCFIPACTPISLLLFELMSYIPLIYGGGTYHVLNWWYRASKSDSVRTLPIRRSTSPPLPERVISESQSI